MCKIQEDLYKNKKSTQFVKNIVIYPSNTKLFILSVNDECKMFEGGNTL